MKQLWCVIIGAAFIIVGTGFMEQRKIELMIISFTFGIFSILFPLVFPWLIWGDDDENKR